VLSFLSYFCALSRKCWGGWEGYQMMKG